MDRRTEAPDRTEIYQTHRQRILDLMDTLQAQMRYYPEKPGERDLEYAHSMGRGVHILESCLEELYR